MERTVELSILLAYYGSFLTERQRKLVAQYVDEDLSLSELAEQENISRQGVHDSLRRSQQQLQRMERELGLIRRSRVTVKALAALEEKVARCGATAVEKAALKSEINVIGRVWEDDYGV